MKLLILSLFCAATISLFAQNESINPQVNLETGNNPVGNQDVSQVENNVEQQTVPQNYNPSNLQYDGGGNTIPVQQQVQETPQNTNAGNVNRAKSTSRSYSGGGVSMGSGKAHKVSFFKKVGKKIEKFTYKNGGKKKFRPRHKRNKRNIIRCFG